MTGIIRIKTSLINPLIRTIESIPGKGIYIPTFSDGQFQIIRNTERIGLDYYSEITIEFKSLSDLFELALNINQK